MGYALTPAGPVWRVCAWCDSKSIVDAEAARLNLPVTHGMCQHHAGEFNARITGDRTFYEQHTQRPTEVSPA